MLVMAAVYGYAFPADAFSQTNQAFISNEQLLFPVEPLSVGVTSGAKFLPEYLPDRSSVPAKCKQQIQMVSVSIQSHRQAEHLYRKFQQDNRLSEIGICLYQPVWLEKGHIHCELNQQTSRNQCNLEPLRAWLHDSAISHLVLILEHGKAYTFQGKMYLDKHDDYNVFVHELAHFAGFMDEYALGQSSAQRYCENLATINVIIDSQETQSMIELWDSQQVQFEMSESQTCRNLDIRTLKPSNQLTFLEYHDTANIPPIYLSLWKHQLNNGFQYDLMRERLHLPLLPFPANNMPPP